MTEEKRKKPWGEEKDLEFKFTMGEGETDAGTFTGYLSVFDMVDSYGDTVKKGAFKKTLREKKQFPLLWSHDIYEPIGIFTAEEDEKGLRIEGKLNLDVQRAREVRSLMAQGAVLGLSIGYNIVKKETNDETGVRQLKELNLWEGSPCVFQACPKAEIDGVKNAPPHNDVLSALLDEEPAPATPKGKPLSEETLALAGQGLKSSVDQTRSLFHN